VRGTTNSSTAAGSRCTAEGAHLVSIGSAREAAFVDGLANGQPYWVALVKDERQLAYTPLDMPLGLEPGWPDGVNSGPCAGCYGKGVDGGGFDKADTDAGVSACVGAFPDAGWLGVECDRSNLELLTICEREVVGHHWEAVNSAFSFTLRDFGKSYVVFYFAPPPGAGEGGGETAANADSNCHALGKSLLQIRSAEERAAITREILDIINVVDFSKADTEFWVGASALDDGRWVWDNDAGDLIPFGDRQPGAGAAGRAFMRVGHDYWDSSLLYAEAQSDALRGYICQSQL
jgi:hypothetical protein